MEYNFSSSQAEMLVQIEKKLKNICISFLDDVNNFIHVLNDEEINKTRMEMNTVIMDEFRDQIKKVTLEFTATLNRVQKIMEKYLI